MIWRIVRSRGFILVFLILAALAYWKFHQGPPKVISVGYIGDRAVILWNRSRKCANRWGKRITAIVWKLCAWKGRRFRCARFRHPWVDSGLASNDGFRLGQMRVFLTR